MRWMLVHSDAPAAFSLQEYVMEKKTQAKEAKEAKEVATKRD